MSKIVLKLQPEFCPGSYDFHAYCKYENPEHHFEEFPHVSERCQTLGEARAQLRSIGWTLHRDRTATCPKCNAVRKGATDA